MNVSIVIPTYNRKSILEKCLKALEKQILNSNVSNYEIVVVDDGSTDGTPSWIRSNSEILPHVVLYRRNIINIAKLLFGRVMILNTL